MAATLTWTEVSTRRQARSHLTARAAADRVADVVRDVCGIQAQLVPAAELALSARVETTRAAVADALWTSRVLVRTYGPRGTMHLLPAEDLWLWLAALRAAWGWGEPAWYERNRLDPERLRALLAAATDALDGRALERQELADQVAARIGDWPRERLASAWADLNGVLAGAGVVVFGPPAAGAPTVVRADQWLGPVGEVDGGKALAELLRRYLRTYGPATHGDFGHWLGLAPARAKELVASLGDEVVRVSVEGRRAWVLAGDETADEAQAIPSPHVRLLARYDAYGLGCRFGRDRVVPDSARARLRAHPRGRYEGAAGHWLLLVDGVVAGMWEREARGETIELRVEAFSRVSRPVRRALEDEAARLGRFLASDVELKVGRLQ